jgi:mannose-6-phosphate isomerase
MADTRRPTNLCIWKFSYPLFLTFGVRQASMVQTPLSGPLSFPDMANQSAEKAAFFDEIAALLQQQGFRVDFQDRTRPWGGFFVLDETQAQQFADIYFDGIEIGTLRISGKLSPKILLVAPDKRLSWQYHHRRAEIWQVVQGPVGVAISHTDAEGTVRTYAPGETIVLQQGERHRLVGLDGWGVVAEIWQHTDAAHPSDENDIVRLQDDFGR